MTKKADTLYIIGNGFDRYHELETSYWHFKEDLKFRAPDVHNDFNEYFNVDKVSENELWENFENKLGEIDIEKVIEDTELSANGPLIKSTTIFMKLKFYMAQWIKQIEDNSIHKLLICKKLNFQGNYIFLNFNYTSTLEKIYDVADKDITYIHGAIKDGDIGFIIGHNSPKPDVPKKYPVSGEAHEKNIIRHYENSEKKTWEIIEENSQFFTNDIIDIKKIYVLGHSMNDIDMPYFRKIKECTDDNNIWYITWFGEDDKINKKNQAATLGINCEFIEMENL